MKIHLTRDILWNHHMSVSLREIEEFETEKALREALKALFPEAEITS